METNKFFYYMSKYEMIPNQDAFPLDAIEDCTHQGECYGDAAYWVKELNFAAPIELVKEYLLNCGFDDEGVLNDTDEDNLIRLFWVVCNDLKENARGE